MNDNIFPIGFWNVLSATQFGMDEVKNYKDIGSTLTMTGFYDLSDDKEGMLAILDECYEQNIFVIFNDRRMYFNNLHHERFKDDMKRLISDFGSHPAVYAFNLGDEPGEQAIDDAVKTVRMFRELCPDKEPFINLLPWVPELNSTGLIAAQQVNYEQHVLDFVRRTGVNILSYDCYMQLCESSYGNLDSIAMDSYYFNLHLFQNVSRMTGAQFFYTTLAVGHGMYRCPTQDDFRWEINTAVAHGVKGLLYWYLYADSYNINYRQHPIDMLFERTDTFRWVSTENRIFQQVYGAVFRKLDLVKIYHGIRAYGGFPLIENSNDPNITCVTTNVGTPIIASVFENKEAPEYTYYALVNNDQRNSVQMTVQFKRNLEVFEVRSGGDHLIYVPRSNHISGGAITLWCSPGQLWVLAVKDGNKKI